MKNQKLLKDVLFETVENSYTFKEDLKGHHTPDRLLKIIADFVNQNYTPKK
jgi:hypothetical protein